VAEYLIKGQWLGPSVKSMTIDMCAKSNDEFTDTISSRTRPVDKDVGIVMLKLGFTVEWSIFIIII